MAYTIKKGDTLSAIAKRQGTTVSALAKANNISDPNKIRAGATLKGVSETAPKAAATVSKAASPATSAKLPTASKPIAEQGGRKASASAPKAIPPGLAKKPGQMAPGQYKRQTTPPSTGQTPYRVRDGIPEPINPRSTYKTPPSTISGPGPTGVSPMPKPVTSQPIMKTGTGVDATMPKPLIPKRRRTTSGNAIW